MIRLLSKMGGNINEQSKETGQTALSFAVEKKLIENINALLDAGADTNIPHKGGYTPLFQAVSGAKDLNIIRALIDAGADKEFMGPHGYYAVDYMKDSRNQHSLDSNDLAIAIDLLTLQ